MSKQRQIWRDHYVGHLFSFGLWLLLLLVLFGVWIYTEDTGIAYWIREATILTMRTLLSVVLITLILFMILLIGIALTVRHWIDSLLRDDERFLKRIGLLLIGLILVNAFPVVFFIDLFKGFSIPHNVNQIMSLIFANAMLYFFISRLIAKMRNEAGKLYVQSAEFKNASADEYLKETMVWILITDLRFLFYYIFSFTLITDAHLPKLHSGIVTKLFNILTKQGWTLEFFVFLLTMMAILLLVRFLLFDLTRILWEVRHGLQTNREN